jgi:hypothetical protein
MHFLINQKVPKNLFQLLLHFFVLTQKNEAKKSQDYACFAHKTYVQKAKTPKLAALRLKQWVFFNAFLSCFMAYQPRSVQEL